MSHDTSTAFHCLSLPFIDLSLPVIAVPQAASAASSPWQACPRWPASSRLSRQWCRCSAAAAAAAAASAS